MTLPDFLTQDSDGFIHLTGHRIGLQHLIHYYNEGYSPEVLAGEYPTLSLAQIHKVIAFYLDHRAETDRYIARNELETERQRSTSTAGPSLPELRERLNAISSAERA